MTWMDLKSFSINDLRRLRDEFRTLLEDRFPIIDVDVRGDKKRCFLVGNGDFVYPAFMYGGKDNVFHCLVIEYAGNVGEIERYEEVEGEQFFPEDFETKELMFEAMFEEINGQS